ncbi:hypothetical protein DPEC_G00342270 [Dallia pectoralis]|uniref:Uncharacterized protein n=1 Tax=Dallia pectoralis TaxID=75939 RepID=A0ACC2F5N5_DALPE|nr:hypothetical protein DPEC_G00342270 [Dallia pectoralis]
MRAMTEELLALIPFWLSRAVFPLPGLGQRGENLHSQQRDPQYRVHRTASSSNPKAITRRAVEESKEGPLAARSCSQGHLQLRAVDSAGCSSLPGPYCPRAAANEPISFGGCLQL